MHKRAVSFYEKLYKNESKEDQCIEQCFFRDLPQISEESNEDLNRPITLEELYKNLQSMECGRVPGMDGLPIEFYKSYWNIIGEDLLEVLNNSLTEGCLPLSCRRAVLTLLPKKGDLTHITSWRPVSLLCCDYKILSKVLATRLGKVLEEVIHPDQSYCIPGRSIIDNISLIRDIFEVVKIFGLNAGLISIDQEKAFDRVEHDYLWKVMKAFGFNSAFSDKIKTLYNDIEGVLKFNGGLCAPFKVHRGIRQGCSLSGMLYALAIEPFLHKLRKELTGLKIPKCDNAIKLSAYADDIVVMTEGQKDIQSLIRVANDFESISSAKINWKKSVAVLLGKWKEKPPDLPGGLIWKKNGFKYLGVYLGDEDTVQKNWEGVIEKIKGRLDRWKWLKSAMSYRGRTIIINNLVASFLWHRLSCVDPPTYLLAKIQSILIEFFWDKLHWVIQNILYLPKEEGGQGLVHLQSRTATFRLQFLQRFLKNSENVSWRTVTSSILKSVQEMNLDKSLFLMDPKKIEISCLPVFYQNLFKVWSCFNVKFENINSLFWLLEEPLINGARLDVMSTSSTFTGLFIQAEITTLKKLVTLVGAELANAEEVTACLKMKSVRTMAQILQRMRSALTSEESNMLNDYCEGLIFPNDLDPFPKMVLSPNLNDHSGIFLQLKSLCLDFNDVNGKQLYKVCVKFFNKKGLHKKVDTPWRDVLRLNENVRPEWRALYKPPLTKKTADIHWRVLHGIIAVNAFVSILNSESSQDCPFCSERETVFHCFTYCFRLKPLFEMLKAIFNCFNEVFSVQTLICGFKYTRSRSGECQLLNFVLGKAKMAIYISRRNHVEQRNDSDVVQVFKVMVKSRIIVDFRFYKVMNNLMKFESIWCYREALCSVVNGELCFALNL